MQPGKHSYIFMLAFLILRHYCFKNNDTITTNSNHNIHRSHLYGTFYGPQAIPSNFYILTQVS